MCPDNTYRPDWKAPTSPDASSCTSCGMGVLADKSDRVTVYNPVTYEPELLPITTGPEDCCKCDLLHHRDAACDRGVADVQANSLSPCK